jgi:purine catabolism regulator
VLTVADVLALPVMRSADPELLTPAVSAQRTVRWVHTSEIYDIGPLLQGNELLLTTGLGLVGESAARIGRYVDSLADRGVAGICLELGRTFDRVPEALRERAGRRGIAVVALHAVVPFVAITEAVSERLADVELRVLRLTDRLLHGVLDGAALEALLTEVATSLASPVRLVDAAGAVVAEASPPAGREPYRGGPPAGPDWSAPDLHWRDIVVAGRTWGRLGTPTSLAAGRALLAGAAQVLAVHVARADPSVGNRGLVRRVLLRELTAEGPVDLAALREAADRLGLTAGGRRELLACAIDVSPAELGTAVVAVAESVRGLGPAVAGELADAVLVVASRPAGLGSDAQFGFGRRVLQAVDAALARRGLTRPRCVVLGDPVRDLAELPRQVSALREAVCLVPHLPRLPPVLRTRDLALHRLLATGINTVAMSRFVDSQLSAVFEHDARHVRGLLPTLEAFLATGGNKRITARALGIQRQTLYDRLNRVKALLEVDLDEPSVRSGLYVAVLAWRLRAGAAGFGPPTRPS